MNLDFALVRLFKIESDLQRALSQVLRLKEELLRHHQADELARDWSPPATEVGPEDLARDDQNEQEQDVPDTSHRVISTRRDSDPFPTQTQPPV